MPRELRSAPYFGAASTEREDNIDDVDNDADNDTATTAATAAVRGAAGLLLQSCPVDSNIIYTEKCGGR